MAQKKNNSNILIADFSKEDFVKVPSFPHPTQKSVMPVVAVRDNQIRLLGTCFAISNHGLVITARHVLDEAINIRDRSNSVHNDNWQVGVLYISEPGPKDDDVPDLMGGLILANRIHTSNEFDIGVMSLNLPVRTEDKSPLPMPALNLSPALPREGDVCLTMGYHSMKNEVATDNVYHHTIEQRFSASKGVIEEIHFPRRDSSKLTFPCFRTSSRFEPGMSGAPICSGDGGVIGVVCSSFKGLDGQGYISYGSLIGLTLFLQIDTINSEGNSDKVFLYDFVTGGSVGSDDTINQLRIRRQENILEINFGCSPTFRGQIDS